MRATERRALVSHHAAFVAESAHGYAYPASAFFQRPEATRDTKAVHGLSTRIRPWSGSAA